MTSSKFDKKGTQGTVWCIDATRSMVDVEKVLGLKFPPLPTTSRNACLAPNLGLWESGWVGSIWVDACLEYQHFLDVTRISQEWLPWKSPKSLEASFLHTTKSQEKQTLLPRKLGKHGLTSRHDILCSAFAGKHYQTLIPYRNLPEILPQKTFLITNHAS